VTCDVFGGAEFRDFLATHPQATFAVLRVVTARLHDADRRRVEFGSTDVLQRVAQVLVELVDRHGVVIDLTQEELAGMVGCSRESIVRALRPLRATEVVATERRALRVLDVGALRDLAR
jgi:CRP-like cAMP-binding protein